MTIGKKLLWGYAFVLMLLIAVTTMAIYSLQSNQTSYDVLVDVNARIVDRVNAMGRSAREQVSHYRGIVIYRDNREALTEQLQISRSKFHVALEDMDKLISAAEDRAMLKEIREVYDRFEDAQNQALELMEDGQSEQGVKFSIDEVAPLSDGLVAIVDRFRHHQSEVVAEVRDELIKDAYFLKLAMIAISVIAIFSGLAIAIVLGRGITRQLQESAGMLSSSAAEILATTTQLATGATETNTAVSETTTTVEEVKQTAQLASEKARQVLDSAQKAAQVSHTGQQSVDAAIEGMHNIQAQMEAIAESIVQLSEQSQSIGEIIVVVSNLAEQSNLLAVNAAIEATRAGEQGKGFAVVAQEVKSLAEQSRQATSQVRVILNDIQKATGRAVLATEQGTKAVTAGVKQSNDAGDVIRMLAEGVSDAADAATQIAASSHQQMVGMDQVAMAMDSIKQASAQNAAGAKQAEGAAQSLHNLGRKLISLVGTGAG